MGFVPQRIEFILLKEEKRPLVLCILHQKDPSYVYYKSFLQASGFNLPSTVILIHIVLLCGSSCCGDPTTTKTIFIPLHN